MLRPTHRTILRRSLAVAGAAALATVALPLGTAFAGTSGTGNTQANLAGGSLSVGTIGSVTTLSGTVAGAATGTLPSVSMSDTTGLGLGWNATVAVSDLTYTGTWTAQSSTALTTATSVAYSDTQDGVQYVVTTGTITAGVGTYTWTSTDTADAAGGSGTAVASTANAVGTKGITINFGTQSLTSGSKYILKAGTQSASALSLSTGGSAATVSGNTAPTLITSGTVTGGGILSSNYGTAVKFATAALGTGMGTYTVTAGVSVATDANSWAATYTAGLQDSIVVGP